MDNVIDAEFTPEYRATIVTLIKKNGIKWMEDAFAASGVHQSFARAIIKSIVRKEGW